MAESPPRARDVLLTALVPAVWGTTYLVVTTFLPPNSPLLAGVLRALPFGVLALLIFRPRMSAAWWAKAAALSVLNVSLFFVLLFVAAYTLAGGTAATLGAMQPLMVVMLAWPMLRLRPTALDIASAVAGLVGVAMLVLGEGAGISTIGVAAALGGAACQALAIVTARRWGTPPVSQLAMAASQMVLGGIPLAIVWLLCEGPPAGATWPMAGACVWLGLVATLGAYAIWFRGIAKLSPATVAVLQLLSPATAVAADMIVKGKWPTPLQWAGAAVVAAAVIGRTLVPTRPATKV